MSETGGNGGKVWHSSLKRMAVTTYLFNSRLSASFYNSLFQADGGGGQRKSEE